MKLEIPTSLCEGPLFFTFMLSLHLLSLCTNWESIVVILSLMCIVPKLIDWFIMLILLVLKLFVSSHPYELWRCPMHLCFGTMRDKLNTTLIMFSICETNKCLSMHYYSWSFVCTFFCCNLVALSYC